MKTTAEKFLLTLPSVLGFLLLAGCNLPIEPAKPDTVRYFVLSGAPGQPAGPANLEVRPVLLPAHLSNRLMVVRLSDHEVRYVDDAHWAEAPDTGLTSRLRGRLQPALPGVSGSTPREYAVRVRVRQCEGVAGGGADAVRFTASFEITTTADDALVVRQAFTATPQAWDGKDYGQLAQHLGEAADELAAAIAAALPKK